MRKKLVMASLIAAVLGIIISGVSISEYLHIQKAGFENASYCAISETINCDIVNASSYATLFGIPVAAWGFLFYLAVAGFVAVIYFAKSPKNTALSFIWGIAAIAFIWSLRMAYVSAYVLHAACITCLTQYIINLFLFVTLYFAGKFTFKNRLNYIFSKKILPHALTVLIIFGLGYVFALSSIKDAIPKPSAEEILTAVNAHFKQSLYDIKPEDLKDAPTWGNPNAKVTIVEFSDFECPFCKIAAFNIKPYLYEFRDNVKFVFKNYPLDNSCNQYMLWGPMHRNSCLAAKAAACAGEKGEFWEYHDGIFKNQNKISYDMLVDLAERLGLEKSWMEQCINSPEALAKIKADIEIAHHVYLTGTPSIIINQRVLPQWRSPEILRAVIREEIKRSLKQVR